MFQIISEKEKQRNGLLQTKSGAIKTPFFMPIATKGAVKNITAEELEEIGAEIVLGNTYHLWLRPGAELIKKAGNLHEFMHWKKPILTDSGGFQIFSLGPRAAEKYGKSGVKLTDEGAEFIDPIDGKKYFMSPEKSVEIQLDLGSDIIMVLDECPPFPCAYEDAEKAVRRTTEWAKRCFEYFNERMRKEGYPEKRPLIFCIIQGSVYEDLRKESARQLNEIGFSAKGARLPAGAGPVSGWDGYAIGGVAVGEPREKLKDILEWVMPLLPRDKPRYLMGLGKPEEIVMAVNAGVDMFDCVIPTREGRHGRLFVWRKNPNLESGILDGTEQFYETINIHNEKYREDFSPVDSSCGCVTCRNYTRGYLRHLFKVGEPLAMRLASLHNLYFYLQMMKRLRGNGN